MIHNLFAGIPTALPDELIENLSRSDTVRIERIVSRGQTSPEGSWYDQGHKEWVILLRGEARLRFASGNELHMKPGDYTTIEAHQRHRVEWTDPNADSIWLAVHFPA